MESYIIVGTAGHVDHGKTVLVKALTGRDTDRLEEERRRGISIELGFAPLTLPGGRKLGLVDVPGHERFIRQMLAGVGGMDLVLLVIAADEGIMPQTREHLDIIDLLRIKRGIVVLTKCDLVDREWLDLVREEVRTELQDTVLAEAPILEVSAVTGQGLPELLAKLEEMVNDMPAKDTSGPARLPVDRAFSLAGFGTIVTGTLWSGTIKVGQQVELLPQQRELKVRSMQVHGTGVKEAFAGQRVAINLPGLELQTVRRGSTVAAPGAFNLSQRVDVELHLLARAPKPFVHRQRVRFYLGTAEILGRLYLLDRDELQPGETCLAQLILEKPVAALTRDRFVLRTYSPMLTVAGGVIIDPLARHHKRFKPEVVEGLYRRLKGSPAELLKDALRESRTYSFEELAGLTGFTGEQLADFLAADSPDPAVVLDLEDKKTVLGLKPYQELAQKLTAVLEEYHRRYPLRQGLSREEVRSRLFGNFEVKEFNAIIAKMGAESIIRVKGGIISRADFSPQIPPQVQKAAEDLLKLYKEAGFQPPSWKASTAELGLDVIGDELLNYLVESGQLVKVEDDLLFHTQAVHEARETIKILVQETGQVELAQVRDKLNSSRKYILPLLEYLDRVKFTRRVGDTRVLYK